MADDASLPPIPLEAPIRLATRARVQTDKVSGKPALLYPEGVLLLNPTGAAIVALCDGTRTFPELVAVLAEQYNAPPDALANDVLEYLNRLRARGLLDIGDGEDTR
jgi:pyrroloquinoline quinone biosynthesis protein D